MGSEQASSWVRGQEVSETALWNVNHKLNRALCMLLFVCCFSAWKVSSTPTVHKCCAAGDGAGVGKGRQIAALIKQHFNDGGRRALWVSVSSGGRVWKPGRAGTQAQA